MMGRESGRWENGNMGKRVSIASGIISVAGLALIYFALASTPLLAKICNMLEWEIPERRRPSICWTLVYKYLEARGPNGLPAIENSLPYSLNLRRLAPRIIENWPSYGTRQIAIGLLRDSDDEVAMNAAYALGKLGGSEVYDPLLKALDHRVPMVRHNALNALNELGQADLAVDTTIRIITNPKEHISVAMSAMALLEKLRDNDNRRRAIVALRRFKDITTIKYRKDDADHAIKNLEILIRLTTG